MEKEERFRLGDWHFRASSSRILGSVCKCIDKSAAGDGRKCELCRFRQTLQLPSLPDMVFASNVLKIRHKSGGGLTFRALDALRQEWAQNRQDIEVAKSVVKPFDWTYTTDYSGTLKGFQEVPTEEKIDYEALTKVQPILFYQSLDLFEDELSDHGCSKLQIKLRCMPTSFFALLQFYLRVDRVLVRVYNTRFFWGESNGNSILKEHSVVQKSYDEMSTEQRDAIMNPSNFSELTMPSNISTYRLQMNAS
ncbi:unnamed protein product [Soboliphyme baturini]|uniref:TIP41-like protein n=1 Tax=Soboliphyme baturini TaxID=241478 RepID=A0A183IVC8_9BILA|nr:unnamed protein product [Soboliphyme baturini]